MPARARAAIARHFAAQRYCGVDLAVGDAAWDYSRLDAMADLTALPFRTGAFDAALNIVTLEHLREPACALGEIARTLAPGGLLLVAAPQEWEVHQAPHDYFRYTRYGLAYLLEKRRLGSGRDAAGRRIFPAAGAAAAQRPAILRGRLRWLGFSPPRCCWFLRRWFCRSWIFWTASENFTLGYICTARKAALSDNAWTQESWTE